jgi:hypothetical protein
MPELETPELDKLHAISEESNAIGQFLDFGLARQGLEIYEKTMVDCECSDCKRLEANVDWHTEDELCAAGWHSKPDQSRRRTYIERPVQYEQWFPTMRSVEKILAEYYGIDLEKVSAEKQAVYEAIKH